MGVGSRRPNVEVVVTGREIITDHGGGAIDCVVSTQCDIELIDEANPSLGRSGRIVEKRRLGLVLEIDGAPVAVLKDPMLVDRMRTCMRRGYGYIGALADHGTALVESAT